ncbi:helix-turn-helix transcriptional regulator [Colwelliaceae bacterium BS250]
MKQSNMNEQYIDLLLSSTRSAISTLQTSINHLEYLKVQLAKNERSYQYQLPEQTAQVTILNENKQPSDLIRLKEVVQMTGLSRSSIYHQIQEQRFPSSISLGARAVAWLRKDIESWIADKISNRTKE